MWEMEVRKDGYYRVKWNPNNAELPFLQERQAVLILHACQTFSTSDRMPCDYEIPVRCDEPYEYKSLNQGFIDGRYEYYLASQDKKQFSSPKTVIFGNPRPLTVYVAKHFLSGIGRWELVLRSPLKLKAGQCGIEYGFQNQYGMFGHITFPGTVREKNAYVLRCRFLKIRPELEARLWFSEELDGLLVKERRTLAQLSQICR